MPRTGLAGFVSRPDLVGGFCCTFPSIGHAGRHSPESGVGGAEEGSEQQCLLGWWPVKERCSRAEGV